MGPSDALVGWDSSSKRRGLRAASGHRLVLFGPFSSKTRGLRVASGHRLVPFGPFFIWCMHKRARLRESPGHIRTRIRSSNCTFTTTSTSIYECCTDVCTHPIGSYDHICNLDHMYMPNCHVSNHEIETYKQLYYARFHHFMFWVSWTWLNFMIADINIFRTSSSNSSSVLTSLT